MFSDKIITFLFLIPYLMVGCAPSEQKKMGYDERIMWSIQTVQEVVRNKKTLFTTDQLTTMIGEPDIKVVVRDFPKMLSHDLKYDSEEIENIVSGVFRAYLWSISSQSPEKEWTRSQEFLQCNLWLYNWNHPHDAYVTGLIPKKIAENSDYFIIQNDKVISSGGIVRPLRKQEEKRSETN